MTSFSRKLAFLIPAIFLSACVQMHNESATGVLAKTSSEIFRASANGVWKTDCNGLGGGIYYTNELTYAPDAFSYTALQYRWTDPVCTNLALRFFIMNTAADYTTTPLPGTTNEFTVAATITGGSIAYTNGGIPAANAGFACGVNTWVNGVFKSWFTPGLDCRTAVGFSVQPTLGMLHYAHAKLDYTASPPVLKLSLDTFPNLDPNAISPTYNPEAYYKQ